MQQYLWLLAPFGFVAVFVVFWCFVCFLISLMSGWGKLGRHFAALNKPTGQNFPWQKVRLNGCSYQGCLSIVIAPQGCYLSLWPLFRPGHPPLLIPWSAFGSFKSEKMFWITGHYTQISIGEAVILLTVYDQNLAHVIEAHRAAQPVSQAITHQI